MNKNTICLSIMTALLAGSFVISGCDELYAVKAMKEKQQQTRSTSVSPAPAYTEETKSPEEIAEQKKDYTSTGRYKDRFLYEKEAPLKPEKELKAEEGAPATKTETAIAASGPDEMNRLRELREEDDKKATAEGKTRPRKIERSDVGLTDPINVPKQQNAEKLTPPAELLRPISLNDTEKKEKGAVPSKPMEEKTSNNDQVNDELKKLASKIENKKSPVLPKDESQEAPAPAAAPKAEPVVASSTKSTETPVPAAGEFDWNKLSAAKNTPATAATATPAKAEPMSAIPAAKEEPKTAAKVEEPVKTEPAVKPEPKVETPKPEPAAVAKTPAPAVKPEAEVKPVQAPAPAPAPAVAVKPTEPAKKPVPVTEARKEEKSSDDSWEMEFVEKTEVAKAEPAKPAPKVETPKPAETKVEKKTDDNLDWGLPEKKTVKEPAAEAATEEPEPKAEEPATVEIKLANSLVPENTYDSNTKKTTPAAAPAEKPVEVAVATPKPAAPAETDKEAEMKLAAENKRKVEVMTKQVQILVKENNDKEALKVINKILAIDPDNSWAKETKNDIQNNNAPKAPKPSTTVKPAPVAVTPKPAPVPATPKPAPAIKPAPVVAAPKPAPKKPEPVFATNEDRTFKGWPGSGMVLKSGMDRLLSWLPDDASKFSNLRLMFTSDGGRKWKNVASNLRPGHAAAWAVPVVTSDNCRLKIIGTDSSGQDVTLAISEKFSVNTGVWETLDSAVVK